MIPEREASSILESFRGKRILVAGDLVLDHYLEGAVSRISPEAPVPVVSLGRDSERWIPGGAANVALNVLSLGGVPVLAGAVGGDSQGEKLLYLLDHAGVDTSSVVVDNERPTSVKTRIMGRNQQLMRVDRETTADLSPELESCLLRSVEDRLPDIASVVLEDYNKGVLTGTVIRRIIANASEGGIPVFVDPKSRNFWEYRGCTLFKPNRHEAAAALGRTIEDADQAAAAGASIMERLSPGAVLLTLGSMGSVLVQDVPGSVRHIPAVSRHVFDVSGAGDSVIAVMGLSGAVGLDVYQAATLANLAAAAVCAEPGVYAVKPGDIIREARHLV